MDAKRSIRRVGFCMNWRKATNRNFPVGSKQEDNAANNVIHFLGCCVLLAFFACPLLRVVEPRKHGTSPSTTESHGPTFVYGILSKPNMKRERDIHRSTWMRSPSVCAQMTSTRIDCPLIVYFVMGRIPSDLERQVDRENSTWGNLIELDLPVEIENVTAFDWFRYAARHFPNARFVGKGEMDTYVYADSLLAAVRQVPQGTQSVYGGVVRGYHECAKQRLTTGYFRPLRLPYFSECPKGWMYMQGGLYFLSQNLVQWLGGSDNEIVQAKEKYGIEDVQVGECLHLSKMRVLFLHVGSSRLAWRQSARVERFHWIESMDRHRR